MKKHTKSLLVLVSLLSVSTFLTAGGGSPTGFHVQPALQIVTGNTISLNWETYNSSAATVKIGTSSNLSGARVLSVSSGTTKKITINSLIPNTRYYYQVTADGATTAIKSFVTALPVGSRTSFRFAVYGDTRLATWYEDIPAAAGDNDDHLPVLQSMATYAPDFAVLTGDLVHDGNNMDDIYNFWDVEKDFLGKTPLFASYGNHEFGGGNTTADTKMDSYLIPAPGGDFSYYSFNYGNVHVVVVNTGTGVWPSDSFDILAVGSPQYNFVAADLAAAAQNPNIDHIFMAMHAPLYSVGNFGDNVKLQTSLENLARQNRVKAIFYGHEHDYQHLVRHGIHHIVTGGAGSPILDVLGGTSAATLVKYEDELNYVILDVNGANVTLSARRVTGNGSSSSSLIESFAF